MAKRSASTARSVCSPTKPPRNPIIVNSAAEATHAGERDVMGDVFAIVGGGPAGLSCAIRLKQLKPETNICVLEKASAVGAQALSGAVMEPGPLDALLPQWREAEARICVPAERGGCRFTSHP